MSQTGLVIRESEPLKPYTTFKIGGPARFFAAAKSSDEFREAVNFAARRNLPLFVLGGGSNLLVSDRGFDGVVIHPAQSGIEAVGENGDSVTLQVHAAERWDALAGHAVERGWWGIENLSHIPGQAGAALVQNIGAYGQQVGDSVVEVEALEIASGGLRKLTNAECGFGYRRSIFNTTARGKLIIVGWTIRLRKEADPHLNYPDVRTYFTERGVSQPSLAEIREAIISIRDHKFPFPREERGGNAGSFFKNLTLTETEYAVLHAALKRNFSSGELARIEDFRHRSTDVNTVKIPAAFLISICGLKGYQVGGAKVNETQPLVLLNQGRATSDDVLSLARHIRKTVRERTAMSLTLEPELVGFAPDELARFEI
jgi:UDP-N-acetylmuramate dehydrogenase